MKNISEIAGLGMINLGHIKPTIAFLMAALGIMMPPENFVAGILLAISGAYFAAIWIPDREKHEMGQVIGLAVFVAILIAIMDPYFIPEIPEQFKMASGGFASRLIIRGAWKLAEEKLQKGGE